MSKITEAKKALYLALLSSNSILSESDIDIMYKLAADKEVQKAFADGISKESVDPPADFMQPEIEEKDPDPELH
jgi:hypothetical protein